MLQLLSPRNLRYSKVGLILNQMRDFATSVAGFTRLVNLPIINLYWSTTVLFYGTCTRSFMSYMKRFIQISGFLEVSHFDNKDKTDKISQVKYLYDYFILYTIFIMRQLQEKHQTKKKKMYYTFVDLITRSPKRGG